MMMPITNILFNTCIIVYISIFKNGARNTKKLYCSEFMACVLIENVSSSFKICCLMTHTVASQPMRERLDGREVFFF